MSGEGATTASRRGGRSELDPDHLAALEEERDFLLRSLQDLEAERRAGDIGAEDYEALKDDYTARAAAALRAVEQRKAAMTEAAAPTSGRRLALAFGGIVLVAVLAGFLLAQASGTRTANEGITGGDAVLTVRDRLIDCAGADARGEALEAVQCYDDVLAVDPDNTEALTYRAWILVRADLYDDAQEYLDHALDVDPTYSDALAFQAISYARQGRVDEARDAVARFRASDPPALMEQLIGGLEQQLADQDAGVVDPDDPTTGAASGGAGP